MRGPLHAKLLDTTAALRRLRVDESGNVIIYVSLSAAVLLGMVGLALDGGRAMVTHSEAQAAADAAALAGASQLDGQSGACGRATAVATGANASVSVVNKERFATAGPANVTITNAVCLSGLPSSDTASTSSLVTTSDAASQYIQVTTQQLTHQNTLLNAAASSNPTAKIQRTAVAGFRRSLCSGSPVMSACDPAAWTAGVAFNAWTNNGPYKGWLDSNSCNNANCVHDELASEQPAFCVVDNSLAPATGNKTNKAAAGINTRFGQSSTTTDRSDADIVDFSAYSKDINGLAGTWDCGKYWSTVHGGTAPAGCSGPTTNTMTRYAMYQLERAGTIPAANKPPAGTPTASQERRLAYIAVFNCGSSGAPEYFLKAFIIAPAQGASNKIAYVEPLGIATSKTDPTAIHEEVQLYR
jgi:Flp pilus assembly protein TadG